MGETLEEERAGKYLWLEAMVLRISAIKSPRVETERRKKMIMGDNPFQKKRSSW